MYYLPSKTIHPSKKRGGGIVSSGCHVELAGFGMGCHPSLGCELVVSSSYKLTAISEMILQIIRVETARNNRHLLLDAQILNQSYKTENEPLDPMLALAAMAGVR